MRLMVPPVNHTKIVQKKKPILSWQGRYHDEKKKPISYNPHEGPHEDPYSKSPQQDFSTSNLTIFIYFYRIIQHHKVGFIPNMQDWLDPGVKSIHVIHHINRLKMKNHMNIAINSEKSI